VTCSVRLDGENSSPNGFTFVMFLKAGIQIIKGQNLDSRFVLYDSLSQDNTHE
jgi:hypothetical protein